MVRATSPKSRSSSSSVAADSVESSLDGSMGYLVRRVYRSFTGALEKRLAAHDITLSMWFFLRLLWDGDGKTQKELSQELGLTQSTTVAAMDNLERRGLIRRYRNLEDRRKTNIFLTPSGRRLKKDLAHYAHEVNEIGLEKLSTGEIALLRHLLTIVNSSLEADSEPSTE